SPMILSMMFGGSAVITTQAAIAAGEQVIVGAKKGKRYQVGRTLANPAGVRNLTSAVVTADATPLVLNTDYTIDLATGGISFLPGGIVVEDDGTTEVTVDYVTAESEFHTVVSGDNVMVEGRLTYIAR